MSKYVRVKTQKQWDIVTKTLNYKWSEHSHWNTYAEDTVINLTECRFGRELSLNSGSDYITFEEFCEKNHLKIKQENNMIDLMNDVLSKTYDNPILRRTTVPLFMSNPGIGKTNITEGFVRKFVESKGNKMVTMVLPNLMPNECVGGVYPNQEKKVWEFYDSEKLLSLKDGDVLFLDEVFNGTLKQTLDAMLNVLGQRRLGSGKMMADVMIVAASNPQGLINLTPQIKERFIRYDLTFNAEEYKSYLKNKYGMPEFISSNLCTLINKEKFDSSDWDFVTPRSIEKAINQIGCELNSPYETMLLPFLTLEIESPVDINFINVKAGDKVPYLNLLKLFIKNNNNNLKSNEYSKNHKQESRVTSDLLN